MNDDTPIMPGPEEEEPTAPQEPGEAAADEAPTREQPPDERRDRPRRLVRSTSDRVIAGVCGGLGDYFGVDPVVFRIGFVVSIFFGGLGALAYLLLAVFVPTDGDPDATQRLGAASRGPGSGERSDSWSSPSSRSAGCSAWPGVRRSPSPSAGESRPQS